MTFDTKCEHTEGWYLCSSENNLEHWAVWCCSARCGHWVAKHPVTGMSYPRLVEREKKITIDYRKGGL